MPPTTETEIKELRDLVIGLREEMRMGFASTDTKLVELKAEMNMGWLFRISRGRHQI
jgi:hypothetical protein